MPVVQPCFSKGGFIVTNANCSTTGLVIALKPLHDLFGIEFASVVTLQAISGAGYPGVASLDILDNVRYNAYNATRVPINCSVVG